MIEAENPYVKDLAIESEKAIKFDEILVNLSNRLEYSEILPWDGEIESIYPKPSTKKSFKEKVATTQLLKRRRSNSISFSTNLVQSLPINKPMQPKPTILEKKLPVLPTKALTQKLHFIKAPFQRASLNINLNMIIEDPNEKPDEIENYLKNLIRKSVCPGDLLKKQELLYEYSPIKAVNKTFEFSSESLKRPKPSYLRKALSSLE